MVAPRHVDWLGQAFMRVFLAAALATPLVGCSREPETVSLSATTFNYSPDDLVFVWVNDKQSARGIDPAKPGEVKGGGGFMCCVAISPSAKSVPVRVEVAKGDDYSVMAPVRQPWPSQASYLVVYVLPGHQILVEAVPYFPIPDPSQLTELQRIVGGTK
jgi:hypothetical protein